MKLRRLNIIPLVMLVAWVPASMWFPQIRWWGIGLILLLQLSIVVYGCMHMQSGYFIPALCKGHTNEPVVALTFDDGPHPALTPQILDILWQHDVRATFFCIGKNIAGNEALLERMGKEGHIVGNHSYSHHFWFDMFGAGKMRADMQQMDQCVEKVLGVKPLLFRPPYGVTNPNVRKAVLKGKYIPVGWSLRSLDTAMKDKKALLARITGKVKAGDIILLHDSMEITAAILPELITTIREKGYRIVGLDEMLHVQTYA